MSTHTAQGPVADEVLSIWKEFDPVEGYAAGYEDCKGRLFVPGDAARAALLGRVEAVRPRLAEIEDEALRAGAAKLLDCVGLAATRDTPEEQVVNCSLALWYAILKREHREGFVEVLLRRADELVRFEHSRWQGGRFTGEARKAAVDACAFLEAILIVLAGKNPDLVDEIGALSHSAAEYRSLFSFPVRHPPDFDSLFAFFEAHAGDPTPNEAYPRILDLMFDYGASAAEIYAHSEAMLGEELRLAREAASRLSPALGVGGGAALDTIYERLGRVYEIRGSVVAEARKMMGAINKYVDRHVQDLGRQPRMMPLRTPAFLEPLVTSGATVALDYVKARPRVYIYVTESRNMSWLTLLNVLVHEAAHAYHPSILSNNPGVPELAKLKSWLAIPLSEAVAFHRETEIFEAVRDESGRKGRRSRVRAGLLGMFDTPEFPLRDDLAAFEFETRIWRVIRALRTLCDVEVNSGRRTYVEFVKWASAHTGVSRKFIHEECFTFLSSPGYAPAYSFCGARYEELQRSAMRAGSSRAAFNTRANRMGLWPWTVCAGKLAG